MNDIYFSFFMFTTNLKPEDSTYVDLMIRHMQELERQGYRGLEFPIPPPNGQFSYEEEVNLYRELRSKMDSAGLGHIGVATNVGATPKHDPTSSDPQIRNAALEYLKSRVDITKALGGEIMMGPIVIPYAAYPTAEDGKTLIWSDELQEHLKGRYENAQETLSELGCYAETVGVQLCIEPITHWEMPGPNKLSQTIPILEKIPYSSAGVVIDSSHEILDGEGPEHFQKQVQWLASNNRLHYVQVSPPDRGALHTCWLPWESFLAPILNEANYTGPIAVEVFNALPEFLNLLRLSRRKFWIPEQDVDHPGYKMAGGDPYNPDSPSAYYIAQEAIRITKEKIAKVRSGQ